MGLGIGLGSFVGGFAKGVGLAGDIEERKQRQQRFDREEAEAAELAGDRQYARDRLRTSDARTDTLNARDDAAYARSEANRVALETIDSDAKSTFNEGVEAGTYKPEDFEKFWREYALPKKQAELVSQGDIEGAKKLLEWGQSADAIAGGKLFASAMWKAQTGDPAGALADAIEAGNVGGYIAHGYEVAGQQEIKDEAGNSVGFRLTIKGPDGKEMVQDIAAGDVGRVVSTFLNPDAAYTSQVAAAAKAGEDQAKSDREVDTYRRKKVVDAEFDGVGGDGGKRRGDAITALRKRLDGGLSGDEPGFDDLKPEEQEKLIAAEIALQTGKRPAPGPAGPQTVVDTLTGEEVRPSTSAAPKTSRARPADVAPAAIGLGDERLTPSDPATLPRTPEDERAGILGEAASVVEGGSASPDDYGAMVARLQAAGVPQDKWPGGLVRWKLYGITPQAADDMRKRYRDVTGGAPIGLGG